MCGRFLLAIEPAGLQDAFPGFDFPKDLKPRFNIAPSQPVLVLANDSLKKSEFFLWGLIPPWTKDVSTFKGFINARAESLSEKPSFRGPFKYHRCLVPANGFFEWKKQPDSKIKQPYFIHLMNNEVFAFAGLWDEVQTPDGSLVKTCAIITTTPNALLEPIHNRMPVILPKEEYQNWLDPLPRTTDELQRYLIPYPSEKMSATKVTTYVNNPENDSPDCIVPSSLL